MEKDNFEKDNFEKDNIPETFGFSENIFNREDIADYIRQEKDEERMKKGYKGREEISNLLGDGFYDETGEIPAQNVE